MARILHVITGLDTGGAEMMLWKLLSLNHGRHTQAVVSLMDEGTIGARIAKLDVPVHALRLRAAAPSPARALAIRDVARMFDPELILGWLYHGNLMASFAGYLAPRKPPVLWGIRQSLDDAAERRRPVVKMSAFLSQRPAAIIYNSRIGARQHEVLGFRNNQQVVIPNGFDCQLFRPDPDARLQVRKELGIRDDAILIGVVARYHPMKDHAGFLRAAARVAQEHPSTRFVFVGRGIVNPALRAMVAGAGLEDRVQLLGERADIPRLTASFDIACSGSAWGEGFSNAIGEAMASAVPCVVTEVGDSPYLVGDAGLSVPPSQPEALALAISQLIVAGAECRQQLGAAARRRVQEHFSLAAVVRRFEQIFQEHLVCHNGSRNGEARVMSA